MADLPIPLEALEDCGAIFGRRGAGKSGTGRVLFEHELEAGHRCCAIDPKGDWWGIRMDKAGGPSGFDIPIFGGAHGDLALTQDMGEMLGRLVATHDLSCVVDLSGFPSQAAMRRFARDFAEALYENNTQPITLFLDEADQLAPQRVPADMARLLHAMENLIRLGRQRGIFMWMLTQRPAVLNTNLRSQAESLIAMKVTTPHDRKAIREWMDAHDPDQAEALAKQLAKLEVGEAFAWVPSADFLERVRFPLFDTYDSGRTPKHGETVEAVKLPSIDLSALQAALASVAADDDGDYPDDTIPAEPVAALKKGGEVGRLLVERDNRIAELEGLLAASYDSAEYWYNRAGDLIEHLRQIAMIVDHDQVHAIERAHESHATAGTRVPAAEPAARLGIAAATAERTAVTAGETAPPPPKPEKIRSAEAAGDRVSSGQQAILDWARWATVMFDRGPVRRELLAQLVGKHVRTKTFINDLGSLRTAGLVDYVGGVGVVLTEAGLRRAQAVDVPGTPVALRDRLRTLLTQSQRRLFDLVVKGFPQTLARDYLAAAVNKHVRTKTFINDLGRLHSLGFVSYVPAGGVRAAEFMMRRRRR